MNAKILGSNPASILKFHSGEIIAANNKINVKNLRGYLNEPNNIIESDLSQKTARKYHNVIADLKSEIIESLVEENRIYGNGNYKPDKVEQDLDNWIEYLNSSYKYLNENLEIMPLHLSIEDSKAPDDNLAIIENSFIYKLCLLVRYNKPRLTYTIINKD